MQWLRMVLVAALAGLFTMALVWVLWDMPARLGATFTGWRAARKRRREARALLAQAREPSEEERLQ